MNSCNSEVTYCYKKAIYSLADEHLSHRSKCKQTHKTTKISTIEFFTANDANKDVVLNRIKEFFKILLKEYPQARICGSYIQFTFPRGEIILGLKTLGWKLAGNEIIAISKYPARIEANKEFMQIEIKRK